MICLTAAQMRELDRRTIEELGLPGMVLMELAGRGVADSATELLPSGGRFVVVAGPGNNGGDGYVAARHLLGRGRTGRVLLLGDPTRLTGDAAANRKLFLRLGGVEVVDDGSAALQPLLDAGLVIDAIFGTGLQREVEGRRRVAIEAINGCARPVLAVDLPSGIDSDTGRCCGVAVRATRTVTFGCLKRGLVSGDGAACAGAISIVDIGIPPGFVAAIDARCEQIDEAQVRALVPAVGPTDHKGTRGHLLVVAGSAAKAGAAWLAARGALRAGVGLVTIVTSVGARSRMGAALPEVMAEVFESGGEQLTAADLASLRAMANAKNAVLVGPGLDHGSETAQVVADLLARLEVPAVVDAEALNLLAGRLDAFAAAGASLVLTPHPGEMARLLATTTREVQSDRLAAAVRCAEACRQVVVLKGARSVVAHPDGRIGVIPIECGALGTAGSGDVLGGVIGSLLARRLDPYQAALLGTYAHAVAGLSATDQASTGAPLASEIAEATGAVLYELARPTP